MKISERLNKGWNAFMNKDPTNTIGYQPEGYVSYSVGNPGTKRAFFYNDESIVDAIINKMAVDMALVDIVHCRLDESERYKEKIPGPIQNCLELEANIDQNAFDFKVDLFSTILENGHAVIAPIHTADEEEKDPNYMESQVIPVDNMRVGKVVKWGPQEVQVDLYNEWTGTHEQVWFKKSAVCIIQNPFYDVMNKPNSALKRLKAKLQLSDIIDEQTANNKFNLIIQMPWAVKTDGKKALAEERVKKLEDQLSKSDYGIGYIDATEHITQLNRALDNHILESIEYYQKLVFDQLGITPAVLNGSAPEEEMNNYYTRNNEPVLVTTCLEIKRKWLSKTARAQRQSILFFRDPFKLVPVTQIPEFADKLTRNEVATGNEVRQAMGMKPSSDPRADELRNKNLSEPNDAEHVDVNGRKFDDSQKPNKEENQNGK